jgi:hypothetical protein
MLEVVSLHVIYSNKIIIKHHEIITTRVWMIMMTAVILTVLNIVDIIIIIICLLITCSGFLEKLIVP